MNRNTRNTFNNRTELMAMAKRVAITILCCVPIIIAYSYLLRNHIKSDAVYIIIDMVIFAVAVVIVELVHKKRTQDKEKIETKRDVFK